MIVLCSSRTDDDRSAANSEDTTAAGAGPVVPHPARRQFPAGKSVASFRLTLYPASLKTMFEEGSPIEWRQEAAYLPAEDGGVVQRSPRTRKTAQLSVTVLLRRQPPSITLQNRPNMAPTVFLAGRNAKVGLDKPIHESHSKDGSSWGPMRKGILRNHFWSSCPRISGSCGISPNASRPQREPTEKRERKAYTEENHNKNKKEEEDNNNNQSAV